ncbi:MAG: UDP-N-acetylmuramate dehydrogenase [Moraxellaceae bacterium]
MAADALLQRDVPLAGANTFGLPGRAAWLADVTCEGEAADVLSLARRRAWPVTVLGGGSNVVLAGDVDGLVLRPRMQGIRLLDESGDTRLVEAMAGENWHAFVRHCLAAGWYGLENLSLIPGTVGAAPVQNIGAYGVELTDVMHSLSAMDRESGEMREFAREECGFAYRDSIFKSVMRDRYLITRVRFQLSRTPCLRLDYGDIRAELAAAGITAPTPLDVSNAVIAIRQRKLPDPAVLGNAGSFFKNPLVPAAQFAALQQQYPGIVGYAQGAQVKLAAGWLIEQAGWKGRDLGRAGCYERQALVLVNRGGATGAEVLALAEAIVRDVEARFGVHLEAEPGVLGR